ncbi:hypothetical protein CERZMDRAFT_40188 [Cercospora zeae-maydis SCOH1-5]|uniref:FYVE-type domain-containing protein n=1 Tax=Cercospora zeae-maydis SCOH1-5 TaxID=717836 RepID=A0A6A6FJ52_9PEZI|nr:hypothetical protein CERZMDRAFT_40188 [Cercospora zeae-maydis SCOH1-5]
MAQRRSLGGGRVLGSGKNLAPATPSSSPAPPKNGQLAQRPALLSPSNSSISLSSRASSTPITTDTEDLTSRVALDTDGVAQAAAAATNRMVCPICNEEMVTLLQLNRHIDDNHANLERIEQQEAQDWFKQQMTKAKKFQPLALINQKLRGLEVFESNNEVPLPSALPRIVSGSRDASPAPVPKVQQEAADPDEVVTRAHWQRPRVNDACSDPICGKRLGAANGQINCRHCGRLFCEEHTMYQMKLSRSAQHEPVRGLWCRVCETCYKSRPGYNDHRGLERNHFDFFSKVRRRTVDKQYLETSRLETRLTRLTQLLADPPPPVEENKRASTYLWSSIAGNKSQIRALEQSVVPWEDDTQVLECPFCHQPFSQYTFRRHHCRICGRVVCGDPATSCSTEIGLDVATSKLSKPGAEKVAVDVRMCRDCQRTIFSKADFARELDQATPDQRAYNNLIQFEQGIRLLLPKFQRLLGPLQDPENPPSPAQLAEASKVRKRLTEAFTQYDVAARRIRDMPTDSPTQERLQKAIYLQASNFLHIHMLPLKSLPKIMKHATPNGLRQPPSSAANGKPQGALATIKYDSITNGSAHRPGSSRASSMSSEAVTALEAEEKELKQRLIVLEEQKFMVSEMIAEANKRRKFDEVSALSSNVEEISREIDQIQTQISGMDFASAYIADQVIK